jgi:acyl-CoA synthetase (AMP-forming)/AMP-acid ligase II
MTYFKPVFDSFQTVFFMMTEETEAFFDADGYVHTGDMGRYDENGILFFEGRLKELIKYKVRCHLRRIQWPMLSFTISQGLQRRMDTNQLP